MGDLPAMGAPQLVPSHHKLTPPHDLVDLLHPAQIERLGGGEHDALVVDAYGDDLEPPDVSRRQHLGHRLDVDLERVDVEVGLAGIGGEPLGEFVERERQVGRPAVANAGARDRVERGARPPPPL